MDVRRDEIVPVAAMFAYFFLVITSYYVIKPVRNSLFLERVGADNLPYIYILTAIVVGVVVSYYARHVEKVRRIYLLLGTLAFLASNLLLFRWALRYEGILTSGTFYIWAKLFPLLLVSQFWLVANELFDTRQAKRLFGLIGGGGILGGVAGAAVAAQLAYLVGTEDLLLVSGGILVVCAIVVAVLAWRYPVLRQPPSAGHASSASRGKNRVSAKGAWAVLRESSHLRTIAMILGTTILVTTLVDYQFNKGVELFIAGEDEKTAFFGRSFAAFNVAAVVVQFSMTSWVLRTFGVGVALLLLPLGLITASFGIVAHPALWTVTLAKGTDGSLRYSLDQSTRELLFLPVPAEKKYKAKPVIDMVVYRGGTGVAGLLLLLSSSVLGLPLRLLSVLTILLAGVWFALAITMRREFRTSVRRVLETQGVDPYNPAIVHLDRTTRRELVKLLGGEDEPKLIYALRLLQNAPGPDLIPLLEPLVSHSSAPVRAHALVLLFDSRDRLTPEQAHRLLLDPALEVRAAAIRCICQAIGADPLKELTRFIADPDERMKAAAVACYVNRFGEAALPVATEMFDALVAGDQDRRGIAAEVIGLLENGAQLRRYLDPLLVDEAKSVRKLARSSAVRIRDPRYVAPLASRLCCPDHSDVRDALSAFKGVANERILSLIGQSEVPLAVRVALARHLSSVGDSEVCTTLALELPTLHPLVRQAALRTLAHNEFQVAGHSVEVASALEVAMQEEVKAAYTYHVWRSSLAGHTTPSDSLVAAAVSERAVSATERVFLVLSLIYPATEVLTAYGGWRATESQVRRTAFELLDNLLSWRHRRQLAALLDPEHPAEEAIRFAVREYGVRAPEPEVLLAELNAGPDPWLAATAWYSTGERASPPQRAVPRPRSPFHLHALGTRGMSLESLLSGEPHLLLQFLSAVDCLRKTDLFHRVHTDKLAVFAARAYEQEFREGGIAFREGQAPEQIFIVVEGGIRVVRQGREVGLAGPGRSAGIMGALADYPRPLTGIANPGTRVWVIPTEDLVQAMEQHPEIADAILPEIARVVERM